MSGESMNKLQLIFAVGDPNAESTIVSFYLWTGAFSRVLLLKNLLSKAGMMLQKYLINIKVSPTKPQIEGW
jgi:hypothetical protein